MKILVTGSSGFVGSKVMEQASRIGWECIGQRRTLNRTNHSQSDFVTSLEANTDWRVALNGVDCVVHCAARVHQMQDSAQDALTLYRDVNTAGTLNLARQAVEAGVKRFIFISSIKVNGEYSKPDQPFLPETSFIPDDPYGLSKYEAEQGLKKLADETGLEVVIIRPPLVYGEGVKANFLSMIQWVEKGIPLPLGLIHNKRSLVYLGNLVDLIMNCCTHTNAPGNTFLVSDDLDVSTTEILKTIANSLAVPSRLLPIPERVLKTLFIITGKKSMAQRLCCDLHVDISETKRTLNWSPPYTFQQGIQKTVSAYLHNKK